MHSRTPRYPASQETRVYPAAALSVVSSLAVKHSGFNLHHANSMSRRKEIYYEPLRKLSNSTVDITHCATPRRFRWIEVAALIDFHLRIVESDKPSIGDIAYATISYVWKGKAHACAPDCLETFHVVGAMEGADIDPISIDLLRTAAFAARDLGAEYLWLDRLCIMQAVRDDKDWQIMNMGDIYRACRTCLIFPGGLQRLVVLEEETNWILRAWTLQEAVAPPSANCVFRFDREQLEYTMSSGNSQVFTIEKGRSARMPIFYMLIASVMGKIDQRCEGDPKVRSYPVSIFRGNATADLLVNALMGIFHCDDDVDAREDFIWRSALLRTSKRPIDMVFSTMALFGVKLDPARYRTREAATIGLAQAILAKGGRANWILASATNTLPTPQFPNACTVDSAGHRTADGKFVELDSAFGVQINVVMSDAPGGVLDDSGTLTVVLPMARVRAAMTAEGVGSVEFLDSEGRAAGADSEILFTGTTPGTHAVIVGTQRVINIMSCMSIPTDTVVILVEKCSHDSGLWHMTGRAEIIRSTLEHCFKEAEVRLAHVCGSGQSQ
ncbi:hypothetical protein BZA05DRAFT_412837 [Tricharina praecox]|uniref:uncharacterized protein n=1 Tax=Tricharina praecox TaxID=43433 RepID=UPI00221EFEDE|nr:uncharacterized protein BZA05DRAFT_412837 [Tricharina praecox]KAI5841721.1 hypothetical protein BZA05DRAFT_412837 [Tricharina praecox]